jgi:hypothetical protein
MNRMLRWNAVAALSIAICAAQAPTFTGFWKLNVAKSSWGSKQRPSTVMLDIDHAEPVLKYSGVVVNVHGEERRFEFAGGTDGKEYPAVRPCGAGRVVLNRVGPYAIVATFKSNDGDAVEKTRMTLSRNGKLLTYDIDVTEGSRHVHWTEVYEKQ